MLFPIFPVSQRNCLGTCDLETHQFLSNAGKAFPYGNASRCPGPLFLCLTGLGGCWKEEVCCARRSRAVVMKRES